MVNRINTFQSVPAEKIKTWNSLSNAWFQEFERVTVKPRIWFDELILNRVFFFFNH